MLNSCDTEELVIKYGEIELACMGVEMVFREGRPSDSTFIEMAFTKIIYDFKKLLHEFHEKMMEYDREMREKASPNPSPTPKGKGAKKRDDLEIDSFIEAYKRQN